MERVRMFQGINELSAAAPDMQRRVRSNCLISEQILFAGIVIISSNVVLRILFGTFADDFTLERLTDELATSAG